ncbi:DUF4274 domain-containing protein [Rufibacter immobilis]|uniref:DUF4274 domain-containing protein n=1 Tax=Rufibacter immobilis TaxID=1348778 RepID=A0A3M9MQU5_9BACT|nr:DUF4274 domain-containing protein [Rufibacter immobilis]RNI27876.1 DUF4274 domain-containing protein [Rufibacter immobilis]
MFFISQSKCDLINANFIQSSIEDEKELFNSFKKLNSSAQLHYLADLFNWDEEKNVLEWIVDSPLCDYGTALLIFWRAQPDFYTQFANEAEAGYEKDTYNLLQKILGNYRNEKYREARIKYLPLEDGQDIENNYPDPKWEIPEEFKKGNHGRTVMSMEKINNFLFNLRRQWKEMQRHRKRNKRRENNRR